MHGKRDVSNLSVLGVGKAAHGSSAATLSCSDPAANARGMPTYDWPIAPLPETKYPFAANEHENMEEEARCIEAARQLIRERRDAGRDVAAIIVAPISGIEMRNATPTYYKQLRLLAKTEGIPFIVDETRTGFG